MITLRHFFSSMFIRAKATPEEAYLAGATDWVDLERRMRGLENRGDRAFSF